MVAESSSSASRRVGDWTRVLEGAEMGRHSSAVAMRAHPEQQVRWWLPQVVVPCQGSRRQEEAGGRKVACGESVSPNPNGMGMITGLGYPQPPCQRSGGRQSQRWHDPVRPRCWRRFGRAHGPDHNRGLDLSRPEPRPNILRRAQSSLCAHEEQSGFPGCNAVWFGKGVLSKVSGSRCQLGVDVGRESIANFDVV